MSKLPGSWSSASIEDAMEAIIDYRGKTPTKTNSGIPLITAKIIDNGTIAEPTEFISEDTYLEWMRRGFPKQGDVLITTEAPLGEVAQLQHERVALAQRVILLRGRSEIVDNSYLKWVLQAPLVQDQLRARSTGSTVLGIKQSELRKVKFPYPPIAEQRRIAAILDRADAIRRKRQQAIALTEELLRSAFLEMFGEYLTLKHSLTFEEVSDVLVDCRNKTAPYVDEGIPLIRTTNFRDCRLDIRELKYVTSETNAIWSARHQTSPGDIVYAREAPFGMAAIVPENFFPCLGQRIMVSRPNHNLVLPDYLLFALNSSFVYKQALEVAVGSTVKHLRVADVNQLRIPVPPIHVQNKFVTLKNQAEGNRIKQISQGKQGERFFNSLLQRAFRGEL